MMCSQNITGRALVNISFNLLMSCLKGWCSISFLMIRQFTTAAFQVDTRRQFTEHMHQIQHIVQQSTWNISTKKCTVVSIFRNSELEIKPSPLTSTLRKALIRSSSVVAGSLRHISQKSSKVNDSTVIEKQTLTCYNSQQQH